MNFSGLTKCILLLAFFLLVSGGALGQTATPTAVDKEDPPVVSLTANDSSDASSETNWFLPTVKAVGGFGIVLVLIIGGFFATRKFAPQFFPPRVGAKSMKLIETISMGDKRSLVLVEVGEDRFLLGNTTQEITLLAALGSSSSTQSSVPDVVSSIERNASQSGEPDFQQVYKVEQDAVRRGSSRLKPIPDDVRNKMRELRAALEA